MSMMYLCSTEVLFSHKILTCFVLLRDTKTLYSVENTDH